MIIIVLHFGIDSIIPLTPLFDTKKEKKSFLSWPPESEREKVRKRKRERKKKKKKPVGSDCDLFTKLICFDNN